MPRLSQQQQQQQQQHATNAVRRLDKGGIHSALLSAGRAGIDGSNVVSAAVERRWGDWA